MAFGFERINFQVLTVFRSIHKAGYFKVKPRPFGAISLRLSGTGIFYIRGEKLVSNPGSILFLPADEPYEVEYSVSESIVIHLVDCNYSHPWCHSVKNQALAEAQFTNLLEAWAHNCSVFQAKAQIYYVLDTLTREQMLTAGEDLFLRCVGYMKEHFSQPSTNIEAVCKELSVSRSTLQRIFSERLGMTPHQYLTKLRIEHSLTLLSTGQLTIKEVSNACGFFDEKYFSSVFKKVYGYCPSYMRDNQKM